MAKVPTPIDSRSGADDIELSNGDVGGGGGGGTDLTATNDGPVGNVVSGSFHDSILASSATLSFCSSSKSCSALFGVLTGFTFFTVGLVTGSSSLYLRGIFVSSLALFRLQRTTDLTHRGTFDWKIQIWRLLLVVMLVTSLSAGIPTRLA